MLPARLSLITGPTDEPLTLVDAKAHLRVEITDDDTYITSLISRAREVFERETGRQLVDATWRAQLDRFPWSDREPIELPKPPLQSVTTVTYLDSSGASQTWAPAEYQVDVFDGPAARRGLLYPVVNEQYPDTYPIPDAVTITFIAGYGNAAAVPEEIKQHMLQLIGHYYEHREIVVVGEGSIAPLPFGVQQGIWGFRDGWFV